MMGGCGEGVGKALHWGDVERVLGGCLEGVGRTYSYPRLL